MSIGKTKPLKQSGKVYLVGAGPGAANLLTVQAHQLLNQAEVLVHDALVNPDVLALVPDECEIHAVGKRGGQPSWSQSNIDQLLVNLCQQEKQVVRLKSGDPFIFGRTISEIQALKAANCEFEVIPGLSSATTAPLLAHIPLTDAVLGSQFTVLTAHDLELHDWQALSKMATLVILMGGKALPEICDRLIHYGKRPETPVAIIRWASQPQQQIWTGTLLTIVQQTKGEQRSPCIIVIGEVVGLRPYLQPL
ncbi:uroporphyrinogen-III C-methyltransferase [Oscillatoria sp. CS-180]|uniref:uroporphyrinogen-III C-methyltransferase n=1 Tax=Oscillatoria sp. CS-180 TaxID=3021720 RepID=UPI00232F7C4E|nr:uroporphyrinogen-III C-methyltransferase [Oscillatoria sp. CS-180]MDB9529249.1 uroporphyrinogen-III C-methyltransferase [Oscillatoria sp. CS-180]